MKKLLLIMFLFFSTLMYSQEKETYVLEDATALITYTKTSIDGILLEQGKFTKSGKRTGTWKQYGANGELLVIAKFKDGRPHGLWRHWSDNKYAEITYVNGKRQSSKLVIEKNWLASN